MLNWFQFYGMNLSIVIPAYNEGRHLEAVLRRLHGVVRVAEPSCEIILVNNGSTDDTSTVAQALSKELPELRIVDVYPNLGYGNGILAGLAAAQGEVLGWVHADDQANPEDLMTVYRKLKTDGFDVCKAVRVERHESRWRVIQSWAYNTLFRLMFGVWYRDINGTPKLMIRSFYERAQLVSKQWFIDPELMLKAAELNARVGEVEIVWNARKGGASKVRLTTMFHFLKLMLRYRYRTHM